MIGPLIGPLNEMAPHARLLYQRHYSPEDVWSSWTGIVKIIDQIVIEQPRLELANSGLYFYFFGKESVEAWVGREIIGHMAAPPEGLGLFDSFKGEIFSWEVPESVVHKMTGPLLLETALSLRALAGTALADTWRVMLQPLEPFDDFGHIQKEMPKVTFQFYKKD